MKTLIHRMISNALLGLLLPLAASAVTRNVTVTPPSGTIHAGQIVSFNAAASTDAPGEHIEFFHVDVSTNNGATWAGYAYPSGLGASYSLAVNVTAGSPGSTLMVRVRVDYRSAAGDVDYTGAPMNWTAWSNWSTPPTQYGSASVAAQRVVTVTPPAGPIYAGQPVAFTTAASTDVPGENIEFFHIDYSTNGGATWTAYAYPSGLGASYTQAVNLTSASAGSTLMVRVRVDYRSSAGDVDYTGAPMNWTAWGNWSTPPSVYGSIAVSVTRTLVVTPPTGTVGTGQAVTFTVSAGTDAPGEQIQFLHIDYSYDSGSTWTPYAYPSDLGASYTQAVNIFSGASGSTQVRARADYRSSAGDVDVDYTGAPMNWTAWGNWSSPPARSASVAVSAGDTLIGTAGTTGLYHLNGTLVKAANLSDDQQFGDGVVVEVFKRSGSTDTVLWSTLLVRPNSTAPAKVNLTVSLTTGDTLRYRLISPTTDTNYDTLATGTQFTMKAASVRTIALSPSIDANDNKTGAIQAALNAAKTEMNTTGTPYDRTEVVLSAGTYYLQDTGAGGGDAMFAITDTQNITLRGAGAKLVINQPSFRSFFLVERSSNIELGDVELDYADNCTPFLQGTVGPQNVDGSWPVTLPVTPLNWDKFAGYSDLFSYRVNPSAPEPFINQITVNSCAISGSAATITTVPSGALANGDKIVMAIRGDNAAHNRLAEAALRLNSTTDCTLRDVTLRAGGWISLMGRQNNGLHFDRYKIDVPSSTRWISTNGDAIQLKDSVRGPTVDSCDFRRELDDGINIHATIRAASGITGTSFTGDSTGIKAGDMLRVFRRSIDSNGNSVPTLYQTAYKVTYANLNTIKVDGSPDPTCNFFVDVSKSGEGFLIRHTSFQGLRNRGGLIQTGYGWIDDCHFLNLGGFGLSFESDLGINGGVEGPYPHDTPVTNSEFNLANNGGQAIQIWGANQVDPPSPMFVALAAAIVNNTFTSQTADPVSVLTGSESFNASANTITP